MVMGEGPKHDLVRLVSARRLARPGRCCFEMPNLVLKAGDQTKSKS
jgi:hypothetical protein